MARRQESARAAACQECGAAGFAVDRITGEVDARGMTNRVGWLRLAAVMVSGVLVAAVFPPFDATWLLWVGMMPLVWALASVSGKRRGWKGFGLGYLGGLASCLIQFQWFGTVSWLGALVMPMYLAVYWGLFGWFAAKAGRFVEKPGKWTMIRVAFCHGAVWGGLEWLRGWMITGFAWNGLGIGLHDMLTMAQAADLVGVPGLSLALVMLQSLAVQAAIGFFHEKRSPRRELVFGGLMAVLWFGYGTFRLAWESKGVFIRAKALLVQLDIPMEAGHMLWDGLRTHQEYEDETFKGLEALKAADGALSKQWPDWVIWPECALTGRVLFTDQEGVVGMSQNNYDTISQVRQTGPFSLIYGVNEQQAEIHAGEPVGLERGRMYNSLAVMHPDDSLQTYRKRHLVIFGETIPFMDSLPWLKKIYEQQSGTEYYGSFTEGESTDPLPLMVAGKTVEAIPTICFEDSVSRLTRKFVRPAPQIIVNVTNDGWFKESAAADQHFQCARFRAIELRRPMLRSANTGISAAIDSTGSTAHPDTGKPQVLTDAGGSHFTQGSMLVEVDIPLHPTFTLYAAIGDAGILVITAIGLVLGLRTRRPDPVG